MLKKVLAVLLCALLCINLLAAPVLAGGANPGTGDESNIQLFIIILAVSGGLLVLYILFSVITKKRK